MPSAYIPIYVAVFFTVVFMLCECLLVSEVMIKTIKVMFLCFIFMFRFCVYIVNAISCYECIGLYYFCARLYSLLSCVDVSFMCLFYR